MSSWFDGGSLKEKRSFRVLFDKAKTWRWRANIRGRIYSVDRLGDYIVTHLLRALEEEPENEEILYCAFQLNEAMKEYEEDHRLLIRLADTGRVVKLLQSSIATITQILQIRKAKVKVQLHHFLNIERNERVLFYQQLLLNKRKLRTEMGDTRQQLEILTRMKHDVTKHYATLSSQELEVISALFDKVVEKSSIVVINLPSWFENEKPSNDIVQRSYPFAGEEECLRHVSIWTQLHHPLIQKFYSACHVGTPYVVHASNFDVDGNFKTKREIYDFVDWGTFLGWALGLQYVHDRGFVYRNLTADHICYFFRESNGNLTGGLSGLGLTVLHNTENLLTHHFWGDRRKHKSKRPDVTSDVMALGLIVFEVLLSVRKSARYEFHLFYQKVKKGFLQRNTLYRHLPSKRPICIFEDEWLLLKQMCAVNPSDRCNMLDVVHEMQLLLCKNHNLCDSIVASVDNISEYVLPTVDQTLAEVFQDAVKISSDLGKLYTTNGAVLKRLTHIYHQLLASEGSLPALLVENFSVILIRFLRVLNQASADSYNSVSTLCASKTIANRNYGLHHDIDRLLFNFSDLRNCSDVHRWQPSWKEACQREYDALITCLSDPLPILSQIDLENDRAEAVALLQFEYRKIGNAADVARMDSVLSRAGNLDTFNAKPLPEWFIPPHHVELGNHIADGSFGAVYHGTWLGTDVVVKLLLTDQVDLTMRRQFRYEADLWFSLNHENVLKLYGVCHEGRPFFVCERAMGGTLVEFAKDKDHGTIWRAVGQVARGLEHLHSRGIIHGDLKGNNILVSDDASATAKLADFGLSIIANAERPNNAEGAIGAYRWKAPECLSGSGPTFASDVYSFAMCIIEVVTGEIPWGRTVPDSVVRHHVVEQRRIPSRPQEFNDSEWEIVEQMCCFNPRERPVVSAIAALVDLYVEKWGYPLPTRRLTRTSSIVLM
ncbi:Serine/threonine protein kinase [Phytophthora megakarya]|uniref:Serine/threonine protein kinase n=1 Tax=Phytophthora megakarya TaxID=4795 RepID=A0A225V2B7_9STRA|nr:Serine/threonine protein kinase [Phytophthora megakarya]